MRNFLLSRLFNLVGMLGAMSIASTPTVCAHGDGNASPATDAPPCPRADHRGPAVLQDPLLRREGHPGARVIDYGLRLVPDERPPPGVECRVLHDTAQVPRWPARPQPDHDTRIPPGGTSRDGATE